MAPIMATKRTSKRTIPDIELEPDAWPRFERFTSVIAKAGPQHRRSVAKPKGKLAMSLAKPTKKPKR